MGRRLKTGWGWPVLHVTTSVRCHGQLQVLSSGEKGIFMASLGLCVFPFQNDKSSTPGLKSNTPTPRNDAPTPGTSTTPGLRSMPGKPPGMDPIGIMGRHDRAGHLCWKGGVYPGQGWSCSGGPEHQGAFWMELGLAQGLPSGHFRVRFEREMDARRFNAHVRGHCWARRVEGASDRSGHLQFVPASIVNSVRL